MKKMMTVRSERYYYYGTDSSDVMVQIDVDTRSELPAVDGIPGRILHQGSSALIISEGRIALLGGDGKWYVGNEVVE